MRALEAIGAWLRRKTPKERHEQLQDRLEDADHALQYARQELARLRGRAHKDNRAIRRAQRRVNRLQRLTARLRRVVDRVGRLLP